MTQRSAVTASTGRSPRSSWAILTVGLVAILALTGALLGPPADAQATSIAITEIFYNPDGPDETTEFLELTNTGTSTVDLSGWTFTSGVSHTFAAGTSMSAGSSLVVASDAASFAAEFGFAPDATFGGNLANGGETLSLAAPSAGGLVAIDAVAYDDATPWPVSADGDGDSLQIINTTADNTNPNNWGAGPPTPRAASDVRVDVIFSTTRGWYNNSQTVTLTPTIPGATIRYNTNGSGTVSTIYNGPITVSDNNSIRVIQAQATFGGQASPMATHTYVFKTDNGIPTVATWNNPVATAPGEVEDTITFEFLPPPSTGLTPVFGFAGMKASEGGVDAGDSDKVFFRGVYGFGTLNGDLFGDDHYGIEPTQKHDQLFLRDKHLDGTHLRQILAHDSLLELGQLSPHGRFVTYHRNGSNEGVRHLQERPEAGFMESYTGIEKSEWIAWSRNENGLGKNSMGAPFNSWSDVTPIINPESLIDSLLVQWQANVSDYRSPKNFRTAGPTSPGAGDGADYRFHYFNWDMDLGYANNLYGRGAPNVWGWAGFVSPDYIAHELDHLPEFRLLASDRIACAWFGGGPLTTTALIARANDRNAELVAAGGTNNGAWINSLQSWADTRNNWLLDQFRVDTTGRTVYHNARPDEAPYKPPSNFNGPLFPDSIPLTVTVSGSTLTISGNAPGTIYYRTDGGDPRTASGALDPAAIQYNGPVQLAGGQHDIIARSFVGGPSDVLDRWSPACNEASSYVVASTPGSIVINELHYNPVESGTVGQADYRDGDVFEFIELHNPGSSPIGVGGSTFVGIDYTVPAGTTIAPGGWLVLASRAPDFINRYGFAPDGDYGGRLNDGGELVQLIGADGTIIDEVTWDDLAPWSTEPDETGPSLSLIDPSLDNTRPQSWGPSTAVNGSPRATNQVHLSISGSIASGCANTDGGLKFQASNPNFTAVTAALEVNGQQVSTLSIPPSGSRNFTETGLADGSYSAVIIDTVSGQTVATLQDTVDCDVTPTVTFAQRCIFNNGVLDFTITNPNTFTTTVDLQIGALARTVTVPAGATEVVAISGRPDGTLGITATTDATFGNQVVLTDSATITCDPAIAQAIWSWSCLSGNGRVEVALTNGTAQSAVFTATIDGIVKTRTLGPDASGILAVSGRQDGPVLAIVERDGVQISNETLTVDCDPDVEIATSATCLAGNGRINVALTNVLNGPVNYQVTVGQVGPRTKILAPQESGLISVTGRPDGPITITVVRNGSQLSTETLTVDCDPDIEAATSATCLGGNGRINVDVTNVTNATADYEVTVGTLAPRDRTLQPQQSARVSVTGRADGSWPVQVTRDGSVVFTDTVVIDCDPDVEVVVTASCLSGNGKLTAALTNVTASAASYTVTFSSPTVATAITRTANLAPDQATNIAVSGRPDGPWTVEVERNGTVVATETRTIAC